MIALDALLRALGAANSVVIAEFDNQRRLLRSNAGMRRLCERCSTSPWDLFTQPRLDALLLLPPCASAPVHAGPLAASTDNQVMISLDGQVYREQDRLVVVAGYDLVEFEQMSSTMLELNDSLTQAYRDLSRTTRELKAREAEILALALTDALTGIGNRRRLDEVLLRETELSHRHGHSLSLMILDIDHFKRVNDVHGHETGDQVLRQTGALLRRELRAGDLPNRMGGEEFVVLMPHTDGQEGQACAERLRLAMQAEDFGDGLHATVSIGVATLLPGESGTAQLARADAALYGAKQTGRNRVIWSTPANSLAPAET